MIALSCKPVRGPSCMFKEARVLLVEDDDDDVFILRRAIVAAELPVVLHVAKSGDEAVDYLSGQNGFGDRKRFPIPDLVFLDLKLPGRDGFDVLAWRRGQPGLKGAHKVQIDFTEARLAVKLDPSGLLLNSFIGLNNLALSRFSAAERQRIGVQTCAGSDCDSTDSADVDYAGLLPSLLELNAGNFYVALAGEKVSTVAYQPRLRRHRRRAGDCQESRRADGWNHGSRIRWRERQPVLDRTVQCPRQRRCVMVWGGGSRRAPSPHRQNGQPKDTRRPRGVSYS
jgi:CheY-like chemotaxis protein